ncbi:MAG: hypothetical protein HQK49_04955 [Oligoflexia bacterium]|nr:hypothetical protein [Oligoflexia bacterium]
MKKTKKLLKFGLLFFVLASVSLAIYKNINRTSISNSTSNTNNNIGVPANDSAREIKTKEVINPNRIIVYYFHGNARCYSCLKIEKLTKETIDEKFQNELQQGFIQWQVVNVDDLKNRHFIKDFKLYTKSVILFLIKENKQKEWKNLQKVWEYLQDEKEFKLYVQREVTLFLKLLRNVDNK